MGFWWSQQELPLESDMLSISSLETNAFAYWILIITVIIATAIPTYLLILKLPSIECNCNKCRKCRRKQQHNPPQISPNRHIRKPKKHLPLSPNIASPAAEPSDDDIESDIMNELDRYHSTRGEKRDIEGLTASIVSSATNTTPRNKLDIEQFEKIKSLEQELSNQKLLNHYTTLRLKKKEDEYMELQKSEKAAIKQIRELFNEISSISKKNADLMTYCESKVAHCRVEYEKMSQKSFEHLTKCKELEKEITVLNKKLSENMQYKNECTKLRANISSLKHQLRHINNKKEECENQVKGLKNEIAAEKHHTNEKNKYYNKCSNDLILYKKENKRLKLNIKRLKDEVHDLEENNEELVEENKEIKSQMDRFSMQLKQNSMIQNEIIDIQKQLSCKASPALTSSLSSRDSDFNENVDSIETAVREQNVETMEEVYQAQNVEKVEKEEDDRVIEENEVKE